MIRSICTDSTAFCEGCTCGFGGFFWLDDEVSVNFWVFDVVLCEVEGAGNLEMQDGHAKVDLLSVF